MAAKSNHKGSQIQVFVREQLEEAQKRFSTFEADAEKALKHLLARGKEQRKELESFVRRFNANGEALLDAPAVRQISKRANQAGVQVRKRLDHLQARVVQAAGVASQAQVREINRELSKLSKKVESLVHKRASRSEASA